MNKKIKQYSALAVAAAAVLPLACSKDDDTNDTNNPNIENKVLNKILSATGSDFNESDSIDINEDGSFDLILGIEAGTYYSTTYASAIIEGSRTGNDLLTSVQTVDGYSVNVLSAKNSGDKINSAAATWTEYGYAAYKYSAEEVGHAGAGDKLFGFRFKAGSNTHYGWMKVNLASDYKTLTIKEVAYHKTPGTEIKAEEK